MIGAIGENQAWMAYVEGVGLLEDVRAVRLPTLSLSTIIIVIIIKMLGIKK